STPPRFNGAGMFPSQKCLATYEELTTAALLQWGRDVSIPEIGWLRKPPRPALGFNGAGMFPSQKWEWRRRIVSPIRRFNGAGMFPSQKSGVSAYQGEQSAASMGPGCFHPRNFLR